MLGVGKRRAKNDLDDAIRVLNKLSKDNVNLTNAKARVDNLSRNLDNVDQFVPGKLKRNLTKAQGELDYVTKINDPVIQDSGILGGIFNKDIKRAKQDIQNSKTNFNVAHSELNAQRNAITNRMSNDLNNAQAEAKYIGDLAGVTDAQKNVDVARQAYDRATRTSNKARAITAGIGLGASAPAIKNNLNNPEAKDIDINTLGF